MGQPILLAKTQNGMVSPTKRVIEKLSQTFKYGTPVQIDNGVDGGVKEWGATVATDLIAGFSTEDAQNIASTGLDAPGPLKAYGGVGSALTYGSVPNQTNAKNVARGGPVQDGRVSFEPALSGSVFSGAVLSTQTTVATDVGKSYGLTKDTDGFWYVDRTKTTVNACVQIMALDPLDGPKLGGRVLFVVLPASAQVLG